MKKLSIKLRLVLLSIISLTLVLTGITLITIALFKKEVGTIFENQTVEKMAFLNTFLEDHLATPISLVENTAAEITVANSSEKTAQVEQELALAARSINGILGLHAAYDGDRMLYSSEKLSLAADYNATERDWYKDAKANPGEVRITEPYVDALTGNLIVGVSKTMDNGKGVITLDLDLSFLESLFSSVNIGQEGYTFVIDREANVLYHPTYEQNESLREDAAFKPFMADTTATLERDGENIYLARYHNDLTGWEIGAIYTDAEIDHVYKGMVGQVISVNAISILILGALFYLLIARSLKPLSTITKFAHQVSQGNLKEQVVVNTKDEIGQLGSTFNDMTDGLKTMIHQVDDTAEKLHSFSTDLSASVEENVQSIYQVVDNIQTVADQTRDQLQAADGVQRAVADMSDEVDVITQNMEQVKQSTKQAGFETTNGAAVISNAISQMQVIERSTTETVTNFEELITVANEIDKFSQVIADIAAQTNLLALNASIEAARAGEHGAGFAVVADEVRKLAEQTNNSASQIQLLVQAIQKTGIVANASIEQSTAAVNQGTAQIHSANEVFTLIQQVMEQLIQNVNVTEKAISTMQQRKELALHSVEEIVMATRLVSSNVDQVAATTEEQNASMEQIAVATESLTTQARELQQSINRFEIK